MREKWFISDTHFFHNNIIKFCDRPFKDADEMNETMIERWNAVVKPQDSVYHLGDVGMGFGGRVPHLQNLLRRLNGHKRLIVGNHDNLKSEALHNNFEKIELWKGWKDFGFTCIHIPIPIAALRDGSVCVHGHIHNNLLEDQRYINLCVEHWDYRPVNLEEILSVMKKRGL